MNKKLRWIIIIIVALIVLLIVLKKAGVLGKDEGTKVSAEKAAPRTIIESVNASGKVYPEIEVKVSPDISGEITELTVQEGDSVRKGQVLARIYADIYTTQRDQAAANVTQQLASVQNAKAQLAGQKAAMEQAKAAYDRQKTLLDQKVISRSEFETAQSAYLSAEATYNAALQGIRSSEASVLNAQAQLSGADKNLGRTTIVAPMDGVVSLLAVKKGERVVGTAQMAGTEMMRIADMNTIEVQVDVSENDIPKVHLGDSAIVEVDAYTNRKFKGIVTQIASSTTTATSTASTNEVTNYKVHVRLLPETYKDLMDPSRPKSFPFRPGMSASADIQTKRIDNVLSVPINAVTTREKGSDKPSEKKKEENSEEQGNADMVVSDDPDEVVFVRQADNTVKKIVVKTGIQDINYIQVTSGLKGGEEVITGPYSTVSKTLRDGMKVNVVPKDKLFEVKK
ncbi:MAG: efflux RND transporter periplasmic adaptor subunit [Chitinophagaceae bacterium]